MTATMNSESVNNLFELIENGLNQQVLELVADKPSLINSVSEQGLSLIETAIKNGFTGLVIELLSFETLDVNHSGHNPLRIAVATGNLSVAAALLDKGASPNYRSEGMSSSLLLCLESEYFALAKKMIKHGAEVDIRNEHGWTPLIWASIKGRLKAVEFLLNHGANIHACNNDGWNALTGAYFKKQTAVVNLLLEKGAVFSEKYAEAAVLSAYQSGFLDVVEYLLNEMDVNPNIADDKNESLLAKAVTKGDWAMVKLLLNKKANPNVFDENGFPLIALLARDGHNELIELFLAHGADIHLCSSNGRTAIYQAAAFNQVSTVELLARKGANINVQDSEGLTPLVVAAREGYLEVIELLLELGVNTELKTVRGNTAKAVALKAAPRTSLYNDLAETAYKVIAEKLTVPGHLVDG